MIDTMETLYRRYESAVFRFAWGLSGDRGEAEDIVSETFVRLMTRAPKIEMQTALAYLLAIARNTYLSRLRRRRLEVPLPEEMQAPERDPEGRLEEQSRLQSVIDSLGALPEGERAALLLRIDHDLSHEEIACALGISVGAVKVRIHRARLRLAYAVHFQEKK